jgi:hypothetical protein
MMSGPDVKSVWRVKSIKVALQRLVICAHVSVHHPVSLLHSGKHLLFQKVVDSVAGLSPDVGLLFVRNSFLMLSFFNQKLAFEELTVEHLATKAMVDSTVDEVMDNITLSLLQVNLDDECLGCLADKSSWLTHNCDLFVSFSRKNFVQVVLNLGSNIFKAVCLFRQICRIG